MPAALLLVRTVWVATQGLFTTMAAMLTGFLPVSSTVRVKPLVVSGTCSWTLVPAGAVPVRPPLTVVESPVLTLILAVSLAPRTRLKLTGA